MMPYVLSPRNKRRKRFRPGFTLLETIIYILLIGGLMLNVVVLSKTIFSTNARVEAALLIQRQLQFALGQMEYHVQEASSVIEPSSNSTGTVLQLEIWEAARNPIRIFLDQGRIMINEGTSTAVELTSDEVEITDLIYEVTTGTHPSVRIFLSGETRNAAGAYLASASVTGTASLRK